jgi:hypothetical protein
MVLDREDAEQAENIQKMGVVPCVTQTVMQNRAHRKELAATVVQFGQSL